MVDATASRPAKLTNKQRAFIEQYLIDFNATQAAIRAGYSEHTAGSIGAENLRKPQISRAIEARFDILKMSADEVLIGLADHARATMDDFVDDGGDIDVKQARERGKMHLAKKYKKTRKYFKGDLTEVSVEIELHDAQAARVWLGKHHKLFTDRVDMTTDGEKIAIAIVKMDVDEL